MTFAQALALIDTRIERQQRGEAAADEPDVPEELPTLQSLQGAFNGFF